MGLKIFLGASEDSKTNTDDILSDVHTPGQE